MDVYFHSNEDYSVKTGCIAACIHPAVTVSYPLYSKLKTLPACNVIFFTFNLQIVPEMKS